MSNELIIEDLQPGDGKAVVKGALITTQYRGWLADGSEFDSSFSRGKPLGPIQKIGAAPNRRGTSVTFHPDAQIFGSHHFTAATV